MVLPLPRMLVAVFHRLPCVVTLLLLPPMFVAQFARGPCAATTLSSPKRLVAKFKTDPEAVVAEEFIPTTTAAPSSPSAWATAPSPMATATLNNVLVQSALLPIPKNDAHVAFAVGADPNPALANNPLAGAGDEGASDLAGGLHDGGCAHLLLHPRRERFDTAGDDATSTPDGERVRQRLRS